MTVACSGTIAPGGEVVRAWLPVPREYPYQNGFELLNTSPLSVDGPNSRIRSVYLEKASRR